MSKKTEAGSFAPTAIAQEVPNAAVELSADDAAEYARLTSRIWQQPTSVQAQQELLSFKSLKGIA